LNESWRAFKALETAEILLNLPHPLVKPLPNSEKNLLRVRLNNLGQVISVEDIAFEERSGIKRIVQTSDGSFPVIKVNAPFLDLPVKSPIWSDLAKRGSDKIGLLNSARTEATARTWAQAGWKWNNSLEKAERIVDIFAGELQAEPIVEIAKRFQKALQHDHMFISAVCNTTLEQLRKGTLQNLNVALELLVGKGKDNRGKDKKVSVLLVLELDKDTTVYHDQVWRSIAASLPTNLSATERCHKHYATVSAFSAECDLLEEPFPQIKLPVLNAYFPLLSMASDSDKAKCNKRYGLTEYTICPVTSTQSRRMAGALEWLLSRKEGTTWRGVANGRFEMDTRTHKKREDKDLLIVFVDEKPQLDTKTASYFGSGNEIIEAQFEVDAQSVCDALDAVVQEHPKSRLNLFLIRKASDGQAQIALSESPLVKDVLEAAKGWQTAVRANVPDVTLYLQPGKTFDKKEIPEVRDARPLAPYPDQVVRLLSYQWVRDGSSPKGKDGKPQKAKQPIIGPGLGDVLALMLRMEGKWEPAAINMLSLLIRRVGSLLIGLFGAKHTFGPRLSQGKHEPFFDYPRPSREVALRTVAVLGVLLDALNSRKEDYVKEAPYQVGQILALADTLHKDYCTVVRRGQMPNSLIGTSLVRRALDNPAGALADLGERIIEYVRWAKVVQISNDWPQDDQKRIAVNEARKKLRQYGPLAATLDSGNLPTECNDVMKAQLLLGFLANPPEENQDK